MYQKTNTWQTEVSNHCDTHHKQNLIVNLIILIFSAIMFLRIAAYHPVFSEPVQRIQVWTHNLIPPKIYFVFLMGRK